MNSAVIYSELNDQNDKLLHIKNRLRRVITRICGAPPPRGGDVGLTSQSLKSESTFLSELDSVSVANRDIILDISSELQWLESVFNTADAPDMPTGYTTTEAAKAYR